MNIPRAIIRQIIISLPLTSTPLTLLKINNPTQELNGPGKTGTILPIIPIIIKVKEMISKNISILNLKFFK